ncbi:MAG: hypothetical protein JM58_01030 [Peptococcaceae bacterium BICA1-8]|nr:MAG: hypothetical protein JM58_01030 [Peptococcaceae bacterium BICA1-8]
MKRNLRLIAVVLTILLIFALTGCSNQNTAPANDAPKEAPKPEYPTKPITMLIPFSAGGSGDVISRQVAMIAEKYLGQPVVPKNVPGGSGAICITQMLSLPADGYTIMNHSTTMPFTIASGDLDVDIDKIQSIATVSGSAQVIGVLSDAPYQTWDELLAYSKENKLKIGGSQVNGTNHVFYLKLLDKTGLNAEYIPYDGGGDTMLSLLGENVDAIVLSCEPPTQYVEAGQVKLLGITGDERNPRFSDTPTFKELGVDGLENELIWRGYFVQKGTPQEVLDKLGEVWKQVLADPKWDEFIAKNGDDELYRDGATLDKMLRDTIADGQKYFAK